MKIDIPKGLSIYRAAEYAIEQTTLTRHNYLSFVFNDIEVSVSGESYAEDICTIYQLECKVRQLESKLRVY